jgi:autotransporter-associated beta strand protein
MRRILLTLAALTVLTAVDQVRAQAWDAGGADQNFSTPDNWAGNTLPGAGSTITIGSNFDGVPVLDTDMTVLRLFFGDASACPAPRTIDTVSPTKTLTLTTTDIGDGAIEVFDDRMYTINANLTLGSGAGTTMYFNLENTPHPTHAGIIFNGSLSGGPNNVNLSTATNHVGYTPGARFPIYLDFSAAQPATGRGTTTIKVGTHLRISNVNQIFSGNLIYTPSDNDGGNPDAAMLEWAGAGDFTMGYGAGAGELSGSALGFAAIGGDKVFNLGGAAGTLSIQTLVLGSPDSTGTTIIKNSFNNGGFDFHLQTIRGQGAVDARIDGTLEGSGSELTLFGDGIVELAGAAGSMTNGRVHILESTVLVDTASSLTGAGLIRMTQGTDHSSALTADGDAALLTHAAITLPNDVQIYNSSTGNGSATLGGSTAEASTFSGNIFLGNTVAKGVKLTAVAGGITTFSGVIDEFATATGTAGVEKIGDGTVVLTNANAYDGTTVTQGTLIGDNDSAFGAGAITVNGGKLGAAAGRTITNAVTVNAGGAIGGYGTFNPAGGVSLGSDAHLSPGGSIGTVTFGANGLSLTDGTIYDWEWSDTQQDLAVVNGTLTLGGTLTLDVTKLGAGPDPSATPTDYTLLTYGLLSGSASWNVILPDGWVSGGVIVDTANSRLVLSDLATAVPEPASLALLAAGGWLVAGRRRDGSL